MLLILHTFIYFLSQTSLFEFSQQVSDKREAFKYAPDFFKDSVDQYGTLVKSELEKKVVVSLEIKCLHPVGVDITWNISHLTKNVLVKVRKYFFFCSNLLEL